MAQRAPWSGYARDTQSVANLASVTFPAISLPSIPFLDELNRSPAFDVVNIMVAASVPTPAGWTITVDIQYQPVKNGPLGEIAITPTGLAVLEQITAAPAMAMTVTATNASGGVETIAIAYGGAAAPGLTNEDGGSEMMPTTYSQDGLGTIPARIS